MSTDENDESFNFEREFKAKIELIDGTEEYIFSRGPKVSEDEWPFKCFVCRKHDRINDTQQFRQHITSDTHKKSMKTVEGSLLFTKGYRRHLITNGFKLFPGENIEYVTTKLSHRLLPIKVYTWASNASQSSMKILEQDDIMDYNKTSDSPIFGICYGLKMMVSGYIRYHCGLCDEGLSQSEAYQHFIGESHYNQYVNRHFPETLERLEQLFGDTISYKEKKDIIRYMYKKIEKLIGTRPFNLIHGRKFEESNTSFISRLSTMVHYNDYTIRYSDDEFKEILKSMRTGKIVLPDDPPILPKRKSEKTRGTPEIDSDRSSKRRKMSERDDRRKTCERDVRTKISERDGRRKISERDDRRKIIDRDQIRSSHWDNSLENWENYRICCEKAIKRLKDDYRFVYDDSEKHKEYDKQWAKFWSRRTEELKKDGINPRTYDFSRDWERYWRRFVDDCFNEDILKQKKMIRKQLDLPFKDKTPDLPKNFKEKIIRNEYASHKAEESIRGKQNISSESLSAGPITILSVLRLLSALESELGSLGPSVVQLLARVIMHEKTNHSPNDLLRETEYFTFFATALEKLKGGLLAGVIPDIKLDVTCQCVNSLEKLLGLFEEYIRSNPNSTKERVSSQAESTKEEQNVTGESAGPITILSVLRLLAALESELGSLGPTAVQLLARAIMYEKANHTPNDLLHETEYFTLFATALEKLKGSLLAGVIADKKVEATCQCVNNLEKLLGLFEKYIRSNPNSAKDHVPSHIILGIGVNEKEEFPQNMVSKVLFGNEADGIDNRNITRRQHDGYGVNNEVDINRISGDSGGRHYLKGNNKSNEYYGGNSEYIKSGDILKLGNEKLNSDNSNQFENKFYGRRDFGLNKKTDMRNNIDIQKYGQNQIPANWEFGNRNQNENSGLRSNDDNLEFGNQRNQNENRSFVKTNLEQNELQKNYVENQQRFSTQSGGNWKTASGDYIGSVTNSNKKFYGGNSGTGNNSFTGNINAYNKNRESFQGTQKQNTINQTYHDNTTGGNWKSDTSSSQFKSFGNEYEQNQERFNEGLSNRSNWSGKNREMNSSTQNYDDDDDANHTPNDLLHETEYFTLFATALEKLKGSLLAGVIADKKLEATCQCVNNLEKLLGLFEKYIRSNPNSAKGHVPSHIILGIGVYEKEDFSQNMVSKVLFGNEAKQIIPEIKNRNMTADGIDNRNITRRQHDGYGINNEVNVNRISGDSGGRHYLKGNNKSNEYYGDNSQYIKYGDILKLGNENLDSDNSNQFENKFYGRRDFGLNKKTDMRNNTDIQKYGQNQIPANWEFENRNQNEKFQIKNLDIVQSNHDARLSQLELTSINLEIESQIKRNDILISSVPLQYNNMKQLVNKICSFLKININDGDIVSCSRLNRTSTTILLKLSNYRIKNIIMKQYFVNKGVPFYEVFDNIPDNIKTRLYFNDNLPSKLMLIKQYAVKLQNIKKIKKFFIRSNCLEVCLLSDEIIKFNSVQEIMERIPMNQINDSIVSGVSNDGPSSTDINSSTV